MEERGLQVFRIEAVVCPSEHVMAWRLNGFAALLLQPFDSSYFNTNKPLVTRPVLLSFAIQRELLLRC